MSASEILRSALAEAGMTQSGLARASGVHQPTIAQVIAGRRGVSDEMLGRLLACMGYTLRVVREPVRPILTRSETRSWKLHREIAARLSGDVLEQWAPQITSNLERIATGVRGEPHVSNVAEWRAALESRDMRALRLALTGLDRHSIEMREVSPCSGLLSDHEREITLGVAV